MPAPLAVHVTKARCRGLPTLDRLSRLRHGQAHLHNDATLSHGSKGLREQVGDGVGVLTPEVNLPRYIDDIVVGRFRPVKWNFT